MITATFLAIFFVPLFFVVIQKRYGKKKTKADAGQKLEDDFSGASHE